jgi:hypothetical protein
VGTRGFAAPLLGVLVVGAVVASPHLLRRRVGADGLIVVLGVGLAFGASSVSMKLLANSPASRSWLSLAVICTLAGLAGW